MVLARSLACQVCVSRTNSSIPCSLSAAFSFEAARGMRRRRTGRAPVRLTDRQREVVAWAASGRFDKEIARLLGITEDTVGERMRAASQRYGVTKRTSVAVSALFDGTIGFQDITSKKLI